MIIYDNEFEEYNFKILLDRAVSEVYLLSAIRESGSEFFISDLFSEEVWDKLVVGQKRALGYLFNNEIRTSTFLGNLIELVDVNAPAKYKFK